MSSQYDQARLRVVGVGGERGDAVLAQAADPVVTGDDVAGGGVEDHEPVVGADIGVVPADREGLGPDRGMVVGQHRVPQPLPGVEVERGGLHAVPDRPDPEEVEAGEGVGLVRHDGDPAPVGGLTGGDRVRRTCQGRTVRLLDGRGDHGGEQQRGQDPHGGDRPPAAPLPLPGPGARRAGG
ncbi:hypothetical protein K1J57_20040 [Nocardiopsis sp. MT53]|uniref:Uncharacterized protein n=1 Tax=Nocardiopsis changdeensis TaxID=2831969 RepID=A0ABX8BR11_9ACTN|nr:MULTISPECIES: hypothetical protein [Nocardiopsis]QUX24665.1 hypothetical protein KGD84_10590 [Nocardiopsis changdeensis]QYX35053.1 hypothetical protein K1J57_20040 [Nocardiopsis sp. MT53]